MEKGTRRRLSFRWRKEVVLGVKDYDLYLLPTIIVNNDVGLIEFHFLKIEVYFWI